MDAIITAIASTIGAEALKSWGVFAIVLILLGLRLWTQHIEIKSAHQKNEALQKRNDELQDLRVTEARQMIRVAETGTSTMASRGAADQQILEGLRVLGDGMIDLQARLALPKPPPKRRRASA